MALRESSRDRERAALSRLRLSIGTMERYGGVRPAGCPPHLYAVAEQAYRNHPLPRRGEPGDRRLAAGVSGAGKTEANK